MLKFKEAKSCLSSEGFNLRKWASNSTEVMEKIFNQLNQKEPINCDEDQHSFAKISAGGLNEIEPSREQNVLDLNWSLQEDLIV